MKNIMTITILLSGYLFSASLSHDEITNMVAKIKEERQGISLAVLEKTPNPFAIVKRVTPKVKEVKEVEVPKSVVVKKIETHSLTAILNHAAFIDKKWYKVGDIVGIYEVTAIGKDNVTLKSGRETKQLVIPQKKKKFKMFKGN